MRKSHAVSAFVDDYGLRRPGVGLEAASPSSRSRRSIEICAHLFELLLKLLVACLWLFDLSGKLCK